MRDLDHTVEGFDGEREFLVFGLGDAIGTQGKESRLRGSARNNGEDVEEAGRAEIGRRGDKAFGDGESRSTT